jgi:hypothetical protein
MSYMAGGIVPTASIATKSGPNRPSLFSDDLQVASRKIIGLQGVRLQVAGYLSGHGGMGLQAARLVVG